MSSNPHYARSFPLPFAVLHYRDMSGDASHEVPAAVKDQPKCQEDTGGIQAASVEAELVVRMERERADAARETEQRLRGEYEQKLLTARAPIAAAVAAFQGRSDIYFSRVESEVVQLALAIAARILHREAQVDPMLVAALVRIAIDKMREGTHVVVRVAVGKGESWKRYFAENQSTARVEVEEEPRLGEHECMVETELGSANFGLDAQLKEVEQGFFDLLALRPVSR